MSKRWNTTLPERKGKIEVISSKAMVTQQDLALAYTPGVAEPCRLIAEKEDLVYEYTAKGNLVAVLSNGSAVLGLGNIGPSAGKPVMEGKGVLFKKFADIDVFDIELNAKNPDDVIRACEMLEPTFGGINLEDIKSPECFYIEEELKKRLKIPVFHDDQHGTAVISGAAFLNALEVVGKKIQEVRVVFCGGGAAAIACANLYVVLGVKRENITMVDSKGVIYKGRAAGMNPYKERFAIETDKRIVAEALEGADAFIGVSVKGSITAEMVKKMAENPIIFAIANPDPEVSPEEVFRVRPDAIMATGRSDYPNQVNNVLGFPFIFRGALDTMATGINEEMKMAAVKALAELAKQDVPESVSRAYGGVQFRFGRDYLIPKAFDHRVLLWVAPAVAEAAIRSGVARKKFDIAQYRDSLGMLLGPTYAAMQRIKKQAKTPVSESLPKIVFPEGDHPKILKAARIIHDEGIAEPILIGNEHHLQSFMKDNALRGIKWISPDQPDQSEHLESYSERFFEIRKRKGTTLAMARHLMKMPAYFGSMMVEMGHADGVMSGITQGLRETLRPAVQVIGVKAGSRLAGISMMVLKEKILWFADTAINIQPTAEELADIAIQTAEFAKGFMAEEPRVAMLSFSSFGSSYHPSAVRVREAVDMIRDRSPELVVDGEMQADVALMSEISRENFPFNRVPGNANVLIFPDLQSSNIAYKLLSRLGTADAVGPILVGMNKPVFVLQQDLDVNGIVEMAAMTAVEIRLRKEGKYVYDQKNRSFD